MKKVFLLVSAFACLFFVASCQQENLEPAVKGNTVTYTVEAPGALQTKAIADGMNVTELIYEVWITSADKTTALAETGAQRLYQAKTDMFPEGGKNKATVTLDLVNDQHYTVLFWAQVKDAAAYNTANLTAVTYAKDLDKYLANDESLAAFYAVDFVNDGGAPSKTVYLKRPFAQINLCTLNSKAAAQADGDYNIAIVNSKMTLKQVPTVFNIAAEEATAPVDFEFAYNAVPSGDDAMITVNGKPYYYAGMNYVFAGDNLELTYDIQTSLNGSTNYAVVNNVISSVPVKKNYRTNIVGNLLTSKTDYEIIVDAEFNTPEDKYGVVDGQTYMKVENAAEFAYAIANYNLVILANDVNLNEVASRAEADPTYTIAAGKNITLDLNSFTLSSESAQTGKNYNMIDVRGTLNVKNGTIVTKHVGTNMGWNNSTNVFNVTAGGVLNLEGVTAKNLGGSDMAFVAHLNNWGEVTLNVNNSTLEASYIAVRVFNSGNDMNNVTIKNSTLKGKYCFWVHNYTLADFGTQEKVDAHKALLNLDIFNGTNTFENTGKAAVLYGFTNSLYYDANGTELVFDAETLAARLTAAEENIAVALGADIDLPISSLGQITGGSGEYKLGGENTDNITVDLNGKKLNVTTTYWSVLGAKNDDALFTIKNGTMTSSQATGTWNSYDLCFTNCNYAIEDVVFEKAIALESAGKNFTLKNVSISETNDYYAMWIPAKGQTLNIDGLTINSLGRGIKIDEQYVNAPAKVTLNISNSAFKSAKKAAIVVKSVAGAEINASNLDITEVAADTEFAVWVDANAAAYADLVEVNGALCKVEGDLIAVAYSADKLVSSLKVESQAVWLFPSQDGESIELGGKISLAKGASLIGQGDQPVGIDNDWGSTTFASQAHFTDTHIENIFFDDNMVIDAAIANGTVSFKNCIFGGSVAHQGVHFDSGKGIVIFDNCTFVGRNMFGSSLEKVIFNNCTFLNKKSSLTGSDKWTGVNMWGKYEFNNCVFDTEATCNVKTDGVVAAFNGCTYSDDKDVKSVIRNSSNYTATITFDGAAL